MTWAEMLFGMMLGAILATFIVIWAIDRFVMRRLKYERDCYRTALDVLEVNGFFTHKARELVRQHLPQ